MPPTTIKVEYDPCLNQFEQSQIPSENGTYFPAEVVIPGCSNDTQFDIKTDPRFIKTGFETNEYNV